MVSTFPSVAPPSDVVSFWRDAGPAAWFAKNEAFDARFRGLFVTEYVGAANELLASWTTSDEGLLALVLLLDQYPRNSFRGHARMFATDALARAIAATALQRGVDTRFGAPLQAFFYLPFMHSEDLTDQDRCLSLYEPLGGDSLKYAKIHHDAIARFGRFPHRNELLGRESTSDELAYLANGGFGG